MKSFVVFVFLIALLLAGTIQYLGSKVKDLEGRIYLIEQKL